MFKKKKKKKKINNKYKKNIFLFFFFFTYLGHLKKFGAKTIAKLARVILVIG